MRKEGLFIFPPFRTPLTTNLILRLARKLFQGCPGILGTPSAQHFEERALPVFAGDSIVNELSNIF